MKKIVLLSFLLLTYSTSVFARAPQEYCNLKCATPYGQVLGQSEDVQGFSNCRSECVKNVENNVPAALIGTKKEVYSGISWQCVEYARRWWMLELGIRFGSVDTANQIFSLTEATRLVDDKKIPLKSFENSSKVPPRVGDLLIYEKQADNPEFQYGHVAVIVGVNLNKGYIDVAEQNYNNKSWTSPKKYSRRIALELKNDSYSVYDIKYNKFDAKKDNSKEKDMILGWVSAAF